MENPDLVPLTAAVVTTACSSAPPPPPHARLVRAFKDGGSSGSTLRRGVNESKRGAEEDRQVKVQPERMAQHTRSTRRSDAAFQEGRAPRCRQQRSTNASPPAGVAAAQGHTQRGRLLPGYMTHAGGGGVQLSSPRTSLGGRNPTPKNGLCTPPPPPPAELSDP